jgi:hypothetical protein
MKKMYKKIYILKQFKFIKDYLLIIFLTMPRPKKNITKIPLVDCSMTNFVNVADVVNEEVLITEKINNSLEVPQKSKRGRKSKKELELLNSSNLILSNSILGENIILSQNEEIAIDVDASANETKVEGVIKKRGRKPKGGKIVQQISHINDFKETKPNVILHLKCSIKDLQNNLFDSHLNGFDIFTNKNELSYEIISNNEINYVNSYDKITKNKQTQNVISTFNSNPELEEDEDCFQNSHVHTNNDEEMQKPNEIKDIWKKLKTLQHNLHINNICDKKSACFWCTYEFDNPPIYIPKHFIKETYHVYGCFCSPECATAFLMEENIDSSTRFERYHLLNHIYSKIYDYKKNIKPAPKPHYMLEKFYGNLTIQEYRSLLKNERLFLVVDKPLTRILPELHEENDDFIINNKIIPSNTYQIKRKLIQKQNKNTILNEKFGLSS